MSKYTRSEGNQLEASVGDRFEKQVIATERIRSGEVCLKSVLQSYVSMPGCIRVIIGFLILLTQSTALGEEQAVQQVVVYSSLDAIRTQRVLALFRRASGIQVQLRGTFASSDGYLAATCRENEPDSGFLVWWQG